MKRDSATIESTRKTIRRGVAIALSLVALGTIVLRAQVPLEVGGRDRSGSLPEGEGRQLVLSTCTQCHSLGPLVLQRKTAAGWRATTKDMISRGAQIHLDEIAPITAYLTRNYGPDTPPEPVNGKQIKPEAEAPHNEQIANTDLPEGEGKMLIVSACTECHSLNKITEQRKDRAGWQANVNEMIKLGAKLRSDQASVIVAYLSTHFAGQSSSAAGVARKSNGQLESPAATRVPGPSPSSNSALPDGDGKNLILQTCIQCHGISYLLTTQKDAGQWRRTVDDMIARGAQLNRTEARTVVNYLVTYLRKEKKDR